MSQPVSCAALMEKATVAANTAPEFGLDLFNLMYLEIGLLYCLLAWSSGHGHASGIRKFVHRHKHLLEALIGGSYLFFAVKWSNAVQYSVAIASLS